MNLKLCFFESDETGIDQITYRGFLAGFTAVLGKLINLNEGLLVWYRILITVLSLTAILILKKQLQKADGRMVIRLMGIGGVIALHWVCFYGSIKYANVSIGLVCLALSGLFTSMLEPLLTPRKFSWFEMVLGLVSLSGILLIFILIPNTEQVF